jgi:hypothetical protein
MMDIRFIQICGQNHLCIRRPHFQLWYSKNKPKLAHLHYVFMQKNHHVFIQFAKFSSNSKNKVKGSWGRRLLAVAREVTRHGRAHPYSWSITIISLRSKESEESHRSKWKTKLLGMFLAVTYQHASGACQSHSCPVLSLREALRKYVELSPSTLQVLTLQFYKKYLTPTPNLLRISGQYSLRSGIFDTPSARAYLFSPLKVIRVTGSVG